MFRGCCTAIGTLSRRGRFRGNTTTISLARPPAGRAHIRSRAPSRRARPGSPPASQSPSRHATVLSSSPSASMCSTLGQMNPAPRSALAASSAALSSPRAPPEFHPRPDDPRPRLERGSVARLASRRRGERARRVLQLPPEAKHAHVRGPGGDAPSSLVVSATVSADHSPSSPRRGRDTTTRDAPATSTHHRASADSIAGPSSVTTSARSGAEANGDGKSLSVISPMLVSTARVARVLSPTSAVPAATAARARQSSIPICHRKKRPEVPALCGVVVVAIRDPPRRALGMRERRRAQAHPTVERARQSVLQTPRKRRQTHHDFADVFVPVAASASVVVAAGESNDTVRDPRERRDVCLPGLARSCRSNGQSIPTDRATCARPRDARNARIRDGSPPTITAGTLVDSPRDSSTGSRVGAISSTGSSSSSRSSPPGCPSPSRRSDRRANRRARPQRISVADAVSSRARWPPRGPPRGRGDDGFHRRKVPCAKAPAPGLEEVLGDATRQRSSRPGVGGARAPRRLSRVRRPPWRRGRHPSGRPSRRPRG